MTPLQRKFPELYESIIDANKSAEAAELADKDYHAKMRVALRSLRTTLGISAKQFGAWAGVGAPQIYAFESGRRPWGEKALNRLNHN